MSSGVPFRVLLRAPFALLDAESDRFARDKRAFYRLCCHSFFASLVASALLVAACVKQSFIAR